MFFVLRFVAEVWRICPAVEMMASKLDVTLAGVVRSSANSTTSPSTAAGNATTTDAVVAKRELGNDRPALGADQLAVDHEPR